MAQFGTDSVSSGNTNKKPKGKRSRSWFFTYNNPCEGVVAQLMTIFKDVKYVFQLEKGSCLHLQGCIRFDNPVYPAFQSHMSNKIHWERCRNWRSAVKYCSKFDTRVDGPWTNIKIKYRKTVKDPMSGLKLKDWQIEIKNILKGKIDDRKVYWYWESTGGVGKSVFCKHLKLLYGKRMVRIGGTSKDALYTIGKRLSEDKVDVVLVVGDICRSKANRFCYSAIEEIKNGYIYSSKYESSEVVFNIPHVILFANFPPDMTMLSKDRWVVKKI